MATWWTSKFDENAGVHLNGIVEAHFVINMISAPIITSTIVIVITILLTVGSTIQHRCSNWDKHGYEMSCQHSTGKPAAFKGVVLGAEGIVVDIGGTTTDVGMLHQGFPRPAPAEAVLADVRMNQRVPDIISIGEFQYCCAVSASTAKPLPTTNH